MESEDVFWYTEWFQSITVNGKMEENQKVKR